jgi:two-component system, OmpR family, sensor histidine kinase CpxA
MKSVMRSLFLKMFLWFWLTAIVTAVSLVLTFFLGPRSVPSQWHASLTDVARSSGVVAITELERGGAPAASAYLEKLNRDAHLRACLFDSVGDQVAGQGCETFKDMIPRMTAPKTSHFSIKYGIARVAVMLPGSNAREYIFATELPAGPRAAFGINLATIAFRWTVALLVSGFVCYLLARYLTSPILRLRKASQQLAAGDLSTRAAAEAEHRRDELGELVRDFNIMADRIEELISRQRQLIYDLSHELRSPLTRLNIALDLGRQRKGNDPAFDHIEQDLERLNEMVERMLTLAKLDTSATPVQMQPVSLTGIVARIIRDAEFESRGRGVMIKFTADEEYSIQGNEELLYSAVENVIRNAIRYTEAQTSVEIELQRRDAEDTPSICLIIRDYGQGVPQEELANIFQPFYRVANARDRQSGGTGLGLAIADRVVRIHGGMICARNVIPRGLRIEIKLPSSS